MSGEVPEAGGKKADRSSFLTLVAAIAGAVAVLSYVDAESSPVRADYTTAVVAFGVAVLALLGAVAMRVGRKDD
jgi:crotonobetainyl-CoA:carnitine CoA-transferase CaiB-like acyl-CoA transferase